MTNNKPLASELQRIYVQRTSYLLTDCVLREKNTKLIPNVDDDMMIGELFDHETNDVFLSINVSRNYRKEIDKGFRLGTFLYECGWLDDSLKVLNATKMLILELDDDYRKLLLLLGCLQKLLHVQAIFCCYKEASITTSQALSLIEKISNLDSDQRFELFVATSGGIPDSLLANLYHELSVLHFYRSEYDLSYTWGVKALEYLHHDTPHKIIIDVLRQTAKSCVVKRKFQSANLLINSAVRIAE